MVALQANVLVIAVRAVRCVCALVERRHFGDLRSRGCAAVHSQKRQCQAPADRSRHIDRADVSDVRGTWGHDGLRTRSGGGGGSGRRSRERQRGGTRRRGPVGRLRW